MIDSLRHFLILEGITPQARHRLERKLPDWAEQLRARGFTEVGDVRLNDEWTPHQWDAYFFARTLLANESVRAHKTLKITRKHRRMLSEAAHQLRDISGIRQPPDSE